MRPPPPRPPQRRRGHLWFLAALLVFVISIGGGTFFTLERLRQDALAFHTGVTATQTGAFEDQLTQSLDLVDQVLLNDLTRESLGRTADQFSEQLRTESRRLPLLRSLSLLDGHQRVLASSNPADIGLTLALDDLLPAVDRHGGEEASFMRIGLPWSGRDFADGHPLDRPAPGGVPGLGFIPVSRVVQSDGHRFQVVAALNPDYFVNRFSKALDLPGRSVQVWRLDGVLMLSTDDRDVPGLRTSVPALAAVQQESAFGSYQGRSAQGIATLSAYRASRQYPLVVVTAMEHELALRDWSRERLHLLRLIIPALVVVVGLVSVVDRWQLRQSSRFAQALDEEHRRLATVLTAVPADLVLLDGEGRIELGNAGWERFLQDAQAQAPQHGVGAEFAVLSSQLAGAEDGLRARLQACVEQVLGQSAEQASLEYVLRLPQGERWLRCTVRAVPEAASAGAVVMQVDITAQRQAESRLQLAATVFTHAREGIMITDAQGTIVDVNDTFTRITGFDRREAIGANPRLLKSGHHGPDHYATMWHCLQRDGYWYGEVWNRCKNGAIIAEMQTVSVVRDAQGQVQNYVSLFSDITAMKQHEQQLERIAHYDVLTQLPNRLLLADRLQQALSQSSRRKRSLAVVFLDLDGFKVINDRHGHDAGDTLLVTVAQRLKLCLREGDTLARIGGDEFVAVLTDLSAAHDAEQILQRMLQAASDVWEFHGEALQVSASIGATLYPQDRSDADLLMRHADQAMYTAKHAGKNRFHFFDVVEDAAQQSQRDSLERIRLALAQGELVLHYQPKVNMRRGEVVGAEALIRWQHPVRGLLAPAEFLPVIDNTELAVAVGEWVIGAALSQMACWQRQGLDLPVSVNLDAFQLQQSDFVDRLRALLAAHPDVPPGKLELELLETGALVDIHQVSAVMHTCREMGVRFALDDFGTGYSSLTYLKRLPVEVLKIDQSFVRGMLEDPGDSSIVQGVISLAAAFRREVIAEGVESAAHGERLRLLGCELAQGYGISRPMPAEDFHRWTQQWQDRPVCCA